VCAVTSAKRVKRCLISMLVFVLEGIYIYIQWDYAYVVFIVRVRVACFVCFDTFID
jgi:hypothetical protein